MAAPSLSHFATYSGRELDFLGNLPARNVPHAQQSFRVASNDLLRVGAVASPRDLGAMVPGCRLGCRLLDIKDADCLVVATSHKVLLILQTINNNNNNTPWVMVMMMVVESVKGHWW